MEIPEKESNTVHSVKNSSKQRNTVKKEVLIVENTGI